MKTVLALVCFVIIASAVCAEGLNIMPLAGVPDLQGTVNVDGKADEAFWASSCDLGPFGVLDAAAVPSLETKARICALNDGLAIFVSCDYPQPDKLVAVHKQRDSEIWMDECIEVFVQPANAKYRHFVVNPASALFDELERDSTWNADWYAASVTTDRGWDLEILLPWKAFGVRPNPATTWRFNVGRSSRLETASILSSWSPVASGFHMPDRFGYLSLGAKSWVSSLDWGPRTPGSKPASVKLTLSGAPGVTATISGTKAKKITSGAAVTLVEPQDKQGYRNLVLTLSNEKTIGRYIYGVQTSSLREILTRTTGRLNAIKDKSPNIVRTIASIRRQTESIKAESANADQPKMLELEQKSIQLELVSSSLPALVYAQKFSKAAPVLAYGVEVPLLKMLQIDPFVGQTGGAIALKAAKGETTAAQLALFSYERPATQVKFKATQLKNAKGDTIPASAIRARQIGYVLTKTPTYSVKHVGYWPDPLIADPVIDMKPNSRELIWVDLKAPENAVSGDYRGTLQVLAGGKAVLNIPVRLHVWNFKLPKQNHIYTAFGASAGLGVTEESLWDNMLEHRISPYNCVGGPILISKGWQDWSGFDHVELDIDSSNSGVAIFSFNTNKLVYFTNKIQKGSNRVVIPIDKQGLNQVSDWKLSLTGISAAKVRVALKGTDSERILSDTQAQARTSGGEWISEWASVSGNAWENPDVPSVWDWSKFDANMAKRLPMGLTSFIASANDSEGWREWQDHLKKNNWLSMAYTYLMDEPEPIAYPTVNAIQETVKKAAPGIRNMMTSRGYPPELLYVDIWCPEIFSFDPIGAAKEQARGRTCWWYTAYSTRRPFVNLWVDYPAIDCRIWPWMTWKHNLDGMLYWGISYWALANPWDNAMTYVGANGDGSLVYPGKNGEVVDSIRWECLRDGMQDYEVFCMLEAGANELSAQKIRPDLVKKAKQLIKIDDRVVKSYKEFSEDPKELLNARDSMSRVLEEIVKVLGKEPVIKGRPVVRAGLTEAELEKLKPKQSQPTQISRENVQYAEDIAAQPEPGLAVRYDFETVDPFAADTSGNYFHGLINSAKLVAGPSGSALDLGENGFIRMPAGSAVLGASPESGTMALRVRPNTEIEKDSGGVWQGYSMLIYAMPKNLNGLPDGYYEVGIMEHGPELVARCGGVEEALVAAIPTPLRKNQWTHVALTWDKGVRRLYVDGKLAVENTSDFAPPRLDDTPIYVGYHAPSSNWRFAGAVDDVRVYTRALNPEELAALAARYQ